MENNKRIIKFRAWDKLENKMINTRFNLEYYRTGGLSVSTAAKSLGCKAIHPDHFEIMQYAGIKDKNGKEIYEGDIIKLGCYTHIDYPNGFIGVIEWDNESARYILAIKNEKERIAHNTCAGIHNCIADSDNEIIGNIYQNPELLTTNNK